MDVELCLARIRDRLSASGLGPEAVSAFERMYREYRGGQTGRVPWGEVGPPAASDLVALEDLVSDRLAEVGRRHLGQVAWIVVNGGLGTSMHMDRAKSLVPVKGPLTFLDLLARHVLDVRRRCGCAVPLLFMNSFATHEDTLAALAPYALEVKDAGGRALPLGFVQHRFPRIREDDGLPVGDASDRASWAPPGHGDVYLALAVSGLLQGLLTTGIRWAFLSNADNLGASLEPHILGYLAETGSEFALEVTPKTAADVKGGTLIRRAGRLELLEIAQVPPEHLEDFQDLNAFPVFNTNSLWVDLEALARRMATGALHLPLIVNRKRVGDVPVVQLETAMGAGVSSFERTVGLLVGRRRFAPVKTTDDLLVRRSDAFVTGVEAPLVPNPARDECLGPPLVRLDPDYFGTVQGLDLRVPEPLSLVGARSLTVVGDVRFGRGVVVRGDVRLENRSEGPVTVPDGALLEG